MFSKDGKHLIDIKNVLKLEKEYKTRLYKAHKITNNIGSISDIDAQTLIKKTGSIDLITYSFSCQDLSVAGSFWGFNRGMKEESNTRSSLLWEIGRLVKELDHLNKLPKFLLLENVPNMISTRHINDYKVWKKHLLNFNYKTKTYVLNARHFGIPQNRKRVYAISIYDPKNQIQIDDNLEIISDKTNILFPIEIKYQNRITPPLIF